jgi:hypothetical protein
MRKGIANRSDHSLDEGRCSHLSPEKQRKQQKIMNRYETTESWHNDLYKRWERTERKWNEAQAQAAKAATNWEFPVEAMKASPRLPGEDLIKYSKRLKEVTS